MSKCRAMKVIENPFGHDNGALFCDLDSGHKEDWHHDQFQRVKWLVDNDEEAALVPAYPLPPADELPEEKRDDSTTGRNGKRTSAFISPDEESPGTGDSSRRLARQQLVGIRGHQEVSRAS